MGRQLNARTGKPWGRGGDQQRLSGLASGREVGQTRSDQFLARELQARRDDGVFGWADPAHSRKATYRPNYDAGIQLQLLRKRVMNPTPGLVIAVVIAFALDQTLYQMLGSHLGFQGVFDETDHLLTTVLIVWALGPLFDERHLLAALLASNLIDLDHVPEHLGYYFLTDGTSRPYTHSLTTVAAVLLLALVWRHRRGTLLAVALGLCSHFWRDLAEPAGSSVSIFWPLTDRGYHLNPVFYLASVGVFAACGLARAIGRSRLASGSRHGIDR